MKPSQVISLMSGLASAHQEMSNALESLQNYQPKRATTFAERLKHLGKWTMNFSDLVRQLCDAEIAETEPPFTPEEHLAEVVASESTVDLAVRFAAVEAALQAIVRTPSTRKFLERNDPQALHQALEALDEPI